MPIDRKPPTTWPATAHAAAARSNRRRFKALRDAAYAEGLGAYPWLSKDPSFRDFLCLYIAEGYKRNRNVVSIGNSDAAVMKAALKWFRRLSAKPLEGEIQYHADQDLGQIRSYWANQLGLEPDRIRLQRKSNSNGLAGRAWRSQHGVLSVRVNDTYFRSRLQAWIDCIRTEWLNSASDGV
jgi:hypothetical protein